MIVIGLGGARGQILTVTKLRYLKCIYLEQYRSIAFITDCQWEKNISIIIDPNYTSIKYTDRILIGQYIGTAEILEMEDTVEYWLYIPVVLAGS